ncbi:MAG: anti-sigma regulatory factor [Symploca sp. SIO2E6]|nr:anti-sigma regulatory factor [Symploca sp. SIO2E6]
MDLQTEASELACLPINVSRDVVTSRAIGKKHAEAMGLGTRDVIKISTAVSELARNIVQHAKGPGQIHFYKYESNGQRGIGIVAQDQGQGMSDPEGIIRHSASIMSGGLFGSKRAADLFAIDSKPGGGTKVQLVKWAC